ncbi:peptidoglycan DD-metalloendopeptidase family protein [Endothiovibrio diazotrophicus]
MHYRSYVNRDLKSLDGWPPQRRRRRPSLPWLLVGAALCAGAASLTLPFDAQATLALLFPDLEGKAGASVTAQSSPVPTSAESPVPSQSDIAIREGNEDAAADADTITVRLSLPPVERQAQAPSSAPETAPARSSPQAPDNAAVEAAVPKEDEPIAATEEKSTPATTPWTRIEIRKGDNLAKIFNRLGASSGDLHRIISLGGAASELKNIYPGKVLELKLATDGHVQGIRYPLDKLRTLQIEGDNTRFQATIDELAVEHHQAFVAGTIENSLYLAAQRAGMPENLIMEMANIFGWDVDFALDIRKGDSFSVVFEELHTGGEKIEDGPILAAEFVNQGKSYRAVRYVDPNGVSNYYTPEGRSMRKAFLRSPVDFRRISSRFQKERWHPVLGKKRPHRGVDYAAAVGTPVKASGDGKVIWVGRKNGYGKTIVVQHGQRYTTLYAHLNGYKRGIKSGKWVKQGQTIGFVGQTGMATGPHLHYEFRVNGVHRNPLTVKLPKASPIPKRYKNDFAKQIRPLIAALELQQRTLVARNDAE